MKQPKFYNLSNILEAIYNFDSIVKHIQQVKVEAKKINLTSKSFAGGDIELFTYIKISNAYREILFLYRYGPSNQLLADILYGMKPLLKILKKYEAGIFGIRNGALAHFNRDGKGNFSPYWLQFSRARLPQEPWEFDLICSSLDLLRVVLVQRFETELIPFYKKISTDVDKEFNHWKNSLKPRIEFDMRKIKVEINKRFAERGVIKPDEDYIGSFQTMHTN